MKLLVFSLLLFSSFSHAIVDTHVHALSTKDVEVIKYIEDAKKLGVEQSFIYSWSYVADIKRFYDGEDIGFDEFVERENDYIAELQQRFPDQVRGFCSVPWGYLNAAKEIARCHKMGLIGLKVYPKKFWVSAEGEYRARNIDFVHSQVDLDFLNLLIKSAHKNDNMIFGIHSAQMDVNQLTTILYNSQLYPVRNELPFIFLHAFAGQPMEVLNYLSFILNGEGSRYKKSKLFIELSYSYDVFPEGSPLRKEWEKMLYYVGVNRVLFGSDSMANEGSTDFLKHTIEAYKKIFTSKEFERISKENIKAIIGCNENF